MSVGTVDTLYATFDGSPAWNGTYELKYTDHWSNGYYWIYRDSYYWYISESEFLYQEPYSKAQLVFTEETNPEGNITGIINPRGNYTGIDGEPNGVVS